MIMGPPPFLFSLQTLTKRSCTKDSLSSAQERPVHREGVGGDGHELQVELVRGSQVRHHVQARLALGWNKIDATSDILATVTCEVLGVEEDERGLVSKLV